MEVQNETIYILEEFYGTSFDLLSGDEVGKSLKEKYVIEKIIYRGSNSRVYLLRDKNNSEFIAKILLEESLYKYLYNERDILKRLEGTISPKFIEFFKEDKINPPILIMEYIKGVDIFNKEDKMEVVKGIFKAYETLEKNEIFHGDIKIQNLIYYKNKVKILDLGLANIKNQQLGTVKYMAPEIIRENRKDRISDIYSLALMIYEYIYEYPYSVEKLTKDILKKRINYKGNFYFDLLLLSNLNKVAEFRFNSIEEFSTLINIFYFIKEAKINMDKSEFLKIFEEKFGLDYFKNFYYSLYKSSVEKSDFSLEEIDFLLDMYIKESSYRIRDSFDLFYQYLSSIYVKIEKEYLLLTIKNKINSYLDENLRKTEIDFNRDKVESSLLESYNKMILEGSREAEYSLSFYYKDKNINKTLEILENLAKIDYPNSYYQLGVIYNTHFNNDYGRSFEYFLKGAKLGHRGCQNQLGLMYRFGYGVEKDLNESFKWYLKSAKGGHVAAQNNLGFMYKNGYGVEKNYLEALNWYKASALNGNSSAQVNLAFMYREGLGNDKNYQEALNWYRKASENGNINGQVNLGRMYLEGLGTEKNFNLAFKLFERGAKNNNKQGKTYLAYMYQYGLGSEKDETFAKELYEEVVKSGLNLAQYFYGKFLIEGEQKDYEQGIKFLKKSAKQKNTDAMLYLANIYIEGKIKEKSFVKGKKWLENAANEGASQALYLLGKIYFEGKEVLQNYTKAFDYILHSAKLNNKEAQKLLSLMYKNGYGVRKNLGEGEMWANLSGTLEEFREKKEEKTEVPKEEFEKEIVHIDNREDEKKIEKKSRLKKIFSK